MANSQHASSHAKRQVLFVQGGGAHVHDRWDNKLVDSLKRELGSNYEIRYPRMPNESDPHYEDWKRVLEQETEALGDGAIVVGHSIGGTILVNVLATSTAKSKLGAVFLISAPFVGEEGWPSEELKSPPDLGAKLPKGVPVHVYHGLSDEEVPPKHADLYKRAIPQAEVHRLAGRDHQLNNDLKEVAEAINML